MKTTVHEHTPTLRVVAPGGRSLRTVNYCCKAPGASSETQVVRYGYDESQRVSMWWDARLWAKHVEGARTTANQLVRVTLSGLPLHTVSTDAGWRVALAGPAGESMTMWDARGARHRIAYDSLGRVSRIYERSGSSTERCIGRACYGGPEATEGRRAGRPVCEDDEAGRRQWRSYDITGMARTVCRTFLMSFDPVDWVAGDGPLEDESFVSTTDYDATGALFLEVDARGHARSYRHDVAGQQTAVWCRNNGGVWRALLESRTFDASGHAVFGRTSNGIVVKNDYQPADGRLRRTYRERAGKLLQDLHYDYDPKGNVVRSEDTVMPAEWFAGQRLDPVNHYIYDSLSQLLEASGRESIGAGAGPSLPAMALPGDASRLQRYVESYAYDSSGNLVELRHAADAGSYTRRMQVADDSNRSVLDDGSAIDRAAAFDANGNQQSLLQGMPLAWDARNRLHRVTLLSRSETADDEACYAYESNGMRVRKREVRCVAGAMRASETRYLPGLELQTNEPAGESRETIVIGAGDNAVRVVYWTTGKPEGVADGVSRFQCVDRLSSTVMELDSTGAIISYEGFLPYGGSAWWAGRHVVEASMKTRRYSSKERDVTGLHYYGFRYYASWIQRWISPDPAADVDGLNRYCFVGSNPITKRDRLGLLGEDYDDIEASMAASYNSSLVRGLDGYGVSGAEVATGLRHAFELAIVTARQASANLSSADESRYALADDVLIHAFSLSPQSGDYHGRLGMLRGWYASKASSVADFLQDALGQSAASVVWFESETNAGGEVHPNDPEQRLFLNYRVAGLSDTIGNATTLIHEAAHHVYDATDAVYLTGVPDWNGVSVSTVDDVKQRFERALTLAMDYRPGGPGDTWVLNEHEAVVGSRYPAFDTGTPWVRRMLLAMNNADHLPLIVFHAGAEAVVAATTRHVRAGTVAPPPYSGPSRGAPPAYRYPARSPPPAYAAGRHP